MEVKGVITQILPTETGQGKNGEWKKGGFILQQEGKYPKDVSIGLWGDKLDEFKHGVGECVSVSINIESREYNGKWFTNIQAWKIDSDNGVTNQEPAMPSGDGQIPDNASDDLPF